nr:uncharacterized protein LOC108120673 [Drosophila bipectinata]
MDNPIRTSRWIVEPKALVLMNIPDQRSYIVDAKRNRISDHMAYKLNDDQNTTIAENICEYDYPKHFFVEYWYTFGQKAYVCPVKDKIPQVLSLGRKYSAMMWKSSQFIGVAIVDKKEDQKLTKRLVVVRFHPPGNQVGEFSKNVPLGDNKTNGASKSGWQRIIELSLICSWIIVIINVPLFV